MEDLVDMIYRIAPASTPLLSFWKRGRYQFEPITGGGMRKQRRRKAKPVRFTPWKSVIKSHKLHQWTLDVLTTSSGV